MAIIAPFRGVTYNFGETGCDISALVAPPYDVISEEDQEGFYQAHPYNIIRLILGKKKTGDSDWDNRYTRSADDFKRWESKEVLTRSEAPAMYVTSLTYDAGDGGGKRTRWGLIALIRIEDEESGIILPHERTFSAHTEDRLRLMRACAAQFSQVFGLYEDPENRVFKSLERVIQLPPRISFDFGDGTTHKMWVVQDRSIFKEVADAMHEKTIFIADGHHRYETARTFRNLMRVRYGSRPANRAYEYLMMYLSNTDDKGLTILPSHRLIKRCGAFELEAFLKSVSGWFKILPFPLAGIHQGPEVLNLKRRLAEEGRNNTVIGFYHRGIAHCYLFSLKPGARDELGEDLHPSLKKLDVLVLSRFILQSALGFKREDLDNEEIFHYQSDMAKALSVVHSGGYEMAFLVNPTRIEHVKEVAGNSLIMPRKSTYFYPKVLTGLVFNKVDPHEIIQIP